MLPLRPGVVRSVSGVMQVPMLSCPLKQTNEVDFVRPLKDYIRSTYGDDPERYGEECATLNRLRQDMRGAGKDSAAGRDLLYRYYGQLELLDLRFPIDENHIKISFTWFDAFTHKPTSQYSLAYEKASVIFNISAVLSCHAAHQNRHEDTGLKTAYHSFQASAGMFTYINENFLHAPSTDLSRETVKTLISIMLAQAQEVFIEKQVGEKKKPGLIAKLAAQAAYLYAQAVEGVQDNVSRAVFERVWLLLVQIKQHHLASIAQYFQAEADYEANSYGQAISRLQAALNASKEAQRLSNAFPATVPTSSNLTSDTGPILADMTKKQTTAIQERLAEYNRDNDMIYHQPVPSENSLSSIPKLPAAKAIPVSDLYQGQDIQRIIGPDIFQRIVPMSVTESASLYDEEKAKMARAEAERVQTADDELATSLDYLKLPGSLTILKGGLDQASIGAVDADFRQWCAELAGHTPSFGPTFERLAKAKKEIYESLDYAAERLSTEESVCEKMRSKYGAEWTQQPSSRLTTTLRTDARSYRAAVEEASTSDAQLYASFRQHETEFDELRSAGETDEADVLYQRAMIKAAAGRKVGAVGSPGAEEGNLLDEDFTADEGRQSVAEQIERVEKLMEKLQAVKRERAQVLKDLKDKIRDDDISNMLILNKKALSNQEAALFKSELEKFRPYQTRILQAIHKQNTLLKELTRTYGDLLQDRRVRAEQNKYEAFSRQRNAVLAKYRKAYQAYVDLRQGLERAERFYGDMRETVASLRANVEGFVENRRAEGSLLLKDIEAAREAGAQKSMQEMLGRLTVGGGPSPSPGGGGLAETRGSAQHRPPPLMSTTTNTTTNTTSSPSPYQPQQPPPPPPAYNPATSPPITPHYPPQQQLSNGAIRSPPSYGQRPQSYLHPQHRDSASYNPNTYGPPLSSPPAHQQYFSPPPQPSQPPTTTQFGTGGGQQYGQPGWQVPPPPPGPPPSQQQQQQMDLGGQYPAGPGGYTAMEPRRQQQGQGGQAGDLWAGLSGWK